MERHHRGKAVCLVYAKPAPEREGTGVHQRAGTGRGKRDGLQLGQPKQPGEVLSDLSPKRPAKQYGELGAVF